jgi:hypothetical protein
MNVTALLIIGSIRLLCPSEPLNRSVDLVILLCILLPGVPDFGLLNPFRSTNEDQVHLGRGPVIEMCWRQP